MAVPSRLHWTTNAPAGPARERWTRLAVPRYPGPVRHAGLFQGVALPCPRSLRYLLAVLIASSLGSQVPPVHGIQPADLDPSVAPCQDFFQYANGAWLQRNPIPDDQSTWGAFNALRDRNRDVLKAILEAAERAPAQPERQVGISMPAAWTPRPSNKPAAVPAAGPGPHPAYPDRPRLAVAMAQARMEGRGSAFRFEVGQDDRQSTVIIAQFAQAACRCRTGKTTWVRTPGPGSCAPGSGTRRPDVRPTG